MVYLSGGKSKNESLLNSLSISFFFFSRSVSLKVGYCCTIKIKDQDIDVSAESRSYKNAKIQAASKALQALHVETNPKS